LREALARAKHLADNPSAIVWTLRDLQLSRRFYEREGGTLVKTGVWALDGHAFPEVAYGWTFAGCFNRTREGIASPFLMGSRTGNH
jgi:hypothetical protein